MSEEITGKVIYTTEDKGARLVVVEHVTSSNYTRRVACRFYGDKRKEIIDVHVGDEVKIMGGAESREGKNQYAGRWFTAFEAFKCERLKAAHQPLAVTHTGLDTPLGRSSDMYKGNPGLAARLASKSRTGFGFCWLPLPCTVRNSIRFSYFSPWIMRSTKIPGV